MLYVRNLMLTTTEQLINDTFSQYSPVERVKKIRDYAFVHFQSRDGALKALEAFNGMLVNDICVLVICPFYVWHAICLGIYPYVCVHGILCVRVCNCGMYNTVGINVSSIMSINFVDYLN